MTRTDTPNVARLEEKKDSPSTRKVWDGRKKASGSGLWPCTIDGCNKQFAREADLKRHQRTTKLHSMPSFACPQCHATFTRTDAQRRHQKSRHNGVVLEGTPSESSPISPTSNDSATPKGKCKEDTPASDAPPHSASGSHQSATNPNKYYREDANTYTPTYTLYPASSARHPGWTYPVWPSQEPPYNPSSYYRPSSMRHGPTLPPISCSVSDSSRSDSPGSAATSISPVASPESPIYTRIPVNPPIRHHEAAHATPEEVEFTMKAVMRYAEIDSASRRNVREDSPPTQRRYNDRESNEMDTDSRDGSLPLDDIIHHYDSPVHSPMHKPGSLQDILTEDCSPIFHHSADMLKEGTSVSSPSPAR